MPMWDYGKGKRRDRGASLKGRPPQDNYGGQGWGKGPQPQQNSPPKGGWSTTPNDPNWIHEFYYVPTAQAITQGYQPMWTSALNPGPNYAQFPQTQRWVERGAHGIRRDKGGPITWDQMVAHHASTAGQWSHGKENAPAKGRAESRQRTASQDASQQQWTWAETFFWKNPNAIGFDQATNDWYFSSGQMEED